MVPSRECVGLVGVVVTSPTQFPRLRGGPELTTRAQDNINSTLGPLAEALNATPIMGAPPPAWLRPSLLNGFVDRGTTNEASGYHKDALGYVWLTGVITHATGVAGGTLLLVMPLGYRPRGTIIIPVWSSAGAGQAISINADGTTFCQAAVAAAGWLTLNASWLAEL